jgi:cellulose synthase/poly-beta-1,6-N-acetylglucosamine synthase-like glycosyltransferase
MINLLTTTYIICVLLLALYTSGQALLLFRYWRTSQVQVETPTMDDFPAVTVQLPLYNEQYVATRLIDAVAKLDYPRDKLWIQVLDDSTDSTTQIVERYLAKLEEQGINVQHIRRPNRTGYKAGALAYGMTKIKNEFIAIFDADFIPPADFLKQTIPHLVHNPQIGVVQTRWGHLNSDDNWLTRSQTLSIDAHFIIEQTARNRSGWLIPFNGTGGVWRRECIDSAGGWSDDTLTEDLDLSYRAQIIGWESLFLPDIEVPGEIPPQLAAYKQQQSRWAMGNTQCLIKLVNPLLRAKLSLSQKIMAVQHLCQYLPHPLMLMLLLLTPPLLLTNSLSEMPLAPLGIVGLAPPLMYIVSQIRLYDNWLSRLKAFPTLLLIGTGISLSNTLAVIGAIIGVKIEFRRTPKFVEGWAENHYALQSDLTIWLEFVLMGYALWGVWLAWDIQPELVLYLLVYALSFATIVGWSLRDLWMMRRFTSQSHQPHVSGSSSG